MKGRQISMKQFHIDEVCPNIWQGITRKVWDDSNK